MIWHPSLTLPKFSVIGSIKPKSIAGSLITILSTGYFNIF